MKKNLKIGKTYMIKTPASNEFYYRLYVTPVHSGYIVEAGQSVAFVPDPEHKTWPVEKEE
jgi:hypothetical protein